MSNAPWLAQDALGLVGTGLVDAHRHQRAAAAHLLGVVLGVLFRDAHVGQAADEAARHRTRTRTRQRRRDRPGSEDRADARDRETHEARLQGRPRRPARRRSACPSSHRLRCARWRPRHERPWCRRRQPVRCALFATTFTSSGMNPAARMSRAAARGFRNAVERADHCLDHGVAPSRYVVVTRTAGVAPGDSTHRSVARPPTRNGRARSAAVGETLIVRTTRAMPRPQAAAHPATAAGARGSGGARGWRSPARRAAGRSAATSTLSSTAIAAANVAVDGLDLRQRRVVPHEEVARELPQHAGGDAAQQRMPPRAWCRRASRDRWT